jgi:acyl carrier protein phosphodiesterase
MSLQGVALVNEVNACLELSSNQIGTQEFIQGSLRQRGWPHDIVHNIRLDKHVAMLPSTLPRVSAPYLGCRKADVVAKEKSCKNAK